MTESARPRVLVVLPDIPGDLVCSRYALGILGISWDVTTICRQGHRGLLEGLGVRTVLVPDYSGLAEASPVDLGMESSEFDRVVDLHGNHGSHAFVHRFQAETVGVDEPEEDLVYGVGFQWWLTAGERTHAAIRHARAISGFEEKTEFHAELWEAAQFNNEAEAEANRVALCPGSSRLGRAKRVAPAAWKEVARFLRGRGMQLCWFLGPDERDLEAELRCGGDAVQGGPFREVVADQARCRWGMTHDTVHLHIRAHLPVQTAAVFVRGEALEWGGYPRGVSLLEFDQSTLEATAAQQMIDWFGTQLNER